MKIGHVLSKVSVIWKRISEILDAPSPYKSGAHIHLFGRLRNLTANLTAYIFEMKHQGNMI